MPMSERQLDFFSENGFRVEQGPSRGADPALALSEIDDDGLIAAIPESSLADTNALAAEAGRRRLTAAVPALATLCRRFAGFGTRRPVAEQAAAIEALVMIGGRDAAHAVSQLIERAVVQEPTLPIAVNAAARLGSTLSPDALRRLLRHAEPGIRADACRCARPSPDVILILIDLLDDLDRSVAVSAASALGRMGRSEARPLLKGLLRDDPSEAAIDAVSSIADEECAVLLGRIARSRPALAEAALIGLENIDDVRAATIAAAIRRLPRQDTGSGGAGGEAMRRRD
jgi:HEAT repeat protein